MEGLGLEGAPSPPAPIPGLLRQGEVGGCHLAGGCCLAVPQSERQEAQRERECWEVWHTGRHGVPGAQQQRQEGEG